MDETIGGRLRKTAEEVAQRLNDAAQTAGERINEMREIQRLSQQIRALAREQDRCRRDIADMVVRMFDQDTFVESLLRPEYERIKELDVQIARLVAERDMVGQTVAPPATAATAPRPETAPPEPVVPADELDLEE